jgi:hypothetical protein
MATDPGPGTSGKAITSLVLGILSFCVPLILTIPGLILGVLGLADANKGKATGKGLAIAGIFTNVVGIFAGIVYAVILFALVLPALVLPSVAKVRSAANRAKSANNLKQIALAWHNYASTYQGKVPEPISSAGGQPILSWRVAILPYVEQDLLYRRFDLQQPWDSPQNNMLLSSRPMTYADPFLEPQPTTTGTTTTYRTFVGPGTLFSEPGNRARFSLVAIPDGTSNTILAVTALDPVPWSKPEELQYVPGRTVPLLGPAGSDVFIVAMMDGSVKMVKKTISEETLRQAIDPADGQVLGPDW